MKPKLISFILILFSMINQHAQAQRNTQNVKGIVLDKQSQSTIIGASIVLLNTSPLQGATSDQSGKFLIANVNPGRYDVKVTYVGYKELVIPNVVVTSGKEVMLDIYIEENIKSLKGAVIKANLKHKTINEMSSVSARTFSMEEVNRYAGGRSDPARLAANFAGVSSPDDSRNDIVIRGNSPTGVLWRIEGLNIPNPNHFATVGTTGGPVSALNTNMLKNSDFFTSAFPAEYGNANAGVFDLGFRKGNSDKREHTIQFGMLTGLEAMTEGPINKKKGSSYLIAYRYSFTGIAQALGISIGTTATPFYQDLSFKVTSGTSKVGRFTFFGLAGTSNIKFLHNEIDSTDLFADPSKDSYFTSDLGLVGLKHFLKLNSKSFINTVIGGTYATSNFLQDTISSSDASKVRNIENKTTRITYSINSSYNTKVSSSLFIKAGIQAEVMDLNLNYRLRQPSNTWKQIWDFKDYTSLLQAYMHSKWNLNSAITVNAGLHFQYLTLNQSKAIEPRVGIQYVVTPKSTFSAGYGLHSQMQPTDVYFYRSLKSDGTYDQSNLDLGFTRSHHFVLGYEVLPIKDWRIKSEIYYQYLYNVPVTVTPSSFSMLNTGSSFNPNNQGYLVNKGTGENYGIELTIEKFFSKGYYGLLTGTLYESNYKGSDGVKHKTAYNGQFVYNVLLGKEIKFGREKRNAFSVDLKVTQAGGKYFTPIDLTASQIANEQVLQGDAFAFTKRNPNFFRMDLKAGVSWNSKKRKLSQSLFFDIQNITNNKNVFAQRYNPVTHSVNTAYQIGLFPNFVYKLQF